MGMDKINDRAAFVLVMVVMVGLMVLHQQGLSQRNHALDASICDRYAHVNLALGRCSSVSAPSTLRKCSYGTLFLERGQVAGLCLSVD